MTVKKAHHPVHKKMPTHVGPNNNTGAGRVKAPGTMTDQTFHTKRNADVFDGSGKSIKQLTAADTFTINKSTTKRMDVDLNHDGKISNREQDVKMLWAQGAGDRSGWVAARGISHAPKSVDNLKWNPKPAQPHGERYAVDTKPLDKDLRFPNSKGIIPANGNRASHYGERGTNTDGDGHAYLLWNLPNVAKGGVAKDSLVDGQHFVSAKNGHGKEIMQTVTMYEDGDKTKPQDVKFVYGHVEGERPIRYGWVAQQMLQPDPKKTTP